MAKNSSHLIATYWQLLASENIFERTILDAVLYENSEAVVL